jgi:hypothetical protein
VTCPGKLKLAWCLCDRIPATRLSEPINYTAREATKWCDLDSVFLVSHSILRCEKGGLSCGESTPAKAHIGERVT